jgi:CHAT domain-containing protein/Tfp pilus assembly protein PilF
LARIVIVLLALLHLQNPVSSLLSDQKPSPALHWFRRASLYRSQGDFERSLAALHKAYEISRRTPGTSFEGKCLIRMGILEWDLGAIEASASQFSQARTAFEQSFDLRSAEFCEKCLELIRLYVEGKRDRSSRLYYRSIERLERSISIGNELGIEDLKLKCLRQQAITYLALGRLNIYLERCQEGLGIARRISHRIEQARFLNNIGIYYQQRLCFSQAIDCFEQAIAILQRDKEPGTEAECLNNLGLAYRELGNLARAEYYLSRGLSIDRAIGSPWAACIDLENLGTVFLRRGIERNSRADVLKSLDLFRQGLSLMSAAPGDERIHRAALNNIGVALVKLKDFPEARRHLLRAQPIGGRDDDDPGRCQVLNNIGLSYLEQGHIDEALANFKLSFEIASRRLPDATLLGCCFGLGRCYEIRKDHSRALWYYRKAIEVYESQRRQLAAEPHGIGFARDKSDIYGNPIRVLAALYEADPSDATLAEIFDLMERAKARAFLEKVRETRVDESREDRAVLLQRQDLVARNIRLLTQRLRERSSSRDEEQELAIELGLEEEDYLEAVAEAKYPAGRDEEGWGEDIRGVKDVQDMLESENAILLEYYLNEPSSYLIWISPSGAGLCILPARSEIEASLRGFLRFASTRALDAEAGIKAAERIYRQLVPFASDPRALEGRALVVVPDGILYQLPFEALRVPCASGSKYLVEAAAVSYGPSASSLLFLRNSRGHGLWNKDLLALGGAVYSSPADPRTLLLHGPPAGLSSSPNESRQYLSALPFSEKEVLDISRFFASDAVDVLTGKAANETEFKHMMLRDYRIIHIACHGLLEPAAPMRSALVLSQPDPTKEDGLLQTREIYGLSMNAGIVVLSACQSGAGPLEGTEGLMAMARPFFFAGAHSLVASLWQINDRATVFFMHEFYRGLVQGRSASEALQKAKIRMLHSPWRHPFFWSSFLLQGDPAALAAAK